MSDFGAFKDEIRATAKKPAQFESTRAANNWFWKHEVDGLGPSYLVANAVYGDRKIDLKSMNADDVAMFVSVANIVSKVSRNDRADLADAFKKIVETTKHNTKFELEGKTLSEERKRLSSQTFLALKL